MHEQRVTCRRGRGADEAEAGAQEAALCAKLANMTAEQAVLANYTPAERAAYARIQRHIAVAHEAPPTQSGKLPAVWQPETNTWNQHPLRDIFFKLVAAIALHYHCVRQADVMNFFLHRKLQAIV